MSQLTLLQIEMVQAIEQAWNIGTDDSPHCIFCGRKTWEGATYKHYAHCIVDRLERTNRDIEPEYSAHRIETAIKNFLFSKTDQQLSELPEEQICSEIMENLK